jgi:hypothetical protein
MLIAPPPASNPLRVTCEFFALEIKSFKIGSWLGCWFMAIAPFSSEGPLGGPINKWLREFTHRKNTATS